MKLKEVNGKVAFLRKTGNDFVKNEMPVEEAKKMIKNRNVTESDNVKGYSICVDDTYYFEAVTSKSKGEK